MESEKLAQAVDEFAKQLVFAEAWVDTKNIDSECSI